MPFIKIQLIEGRTDKQKAEVAKNIIDVASKGLGAPKKNIKVIFEDMKKPITSVNSKL